MTRHHTTSHDLPRGTLEESTAQHPHDRNTPHVTARDTHIGEVCGMGGTPRPVFARQLCATASLHLAPTFDVHGHTQAVQYPSVRRCDALIQPPSCFEGLCNGLGSSMTRNSCASSPSSSRSSGFDGSPCVPPSNAGISRRRGERARRSSRVTWAAGSDSSMPSAAAPASADPDV